MSLPVQALDRLFSRLAATYGAAWERSLGSTPLADVKTAWSHELSGFSGSLNRIAWADDGQVAEISMNSDGSVIAAKASALNSTKGNCNCSKRNNSERPKGDSLPHNKIFIPRIPSNLHTQSG